MRRFALQQGDLTRMRASVREVALPDPGVAINVGTIIQKVISGELPHVPTPGIESMRVRLQHGGTLVTRELFTMAQRIPTLNDGIQDLRKEVEKFDGVAYDGSCTLKSYTDRQVGKAPHRDANFEGATAGRVTMIGLSGPRQIATWVVPQTVSLPGRSDQDFIKTASEARCLTGFRGTMVDGTAVEFKPVDVRTYLPGEGKIIDERSGAWPQAGTNLPLAIWHSVYGRPEIGTPPVLSMILRSTT